MDRLKKKLHRQRRIKQGIRKKINGTAERPRLTVYRSNRDIYAQLVDDERGVTLLGASSKAAGDTAGKTPIEKAKAVGQALAERAKAENISGVVFDRNGYLYHGRVKALAEGAREGGLNF
jgi:large subunit ribosomal protein L18